MIKGETYDEQLFESRAFRHFVNVFLNRESGITKGCTIQNNKTTIDISSGMFIICGGLLRETTGSTNTVPSEAGYYKLVYEIDLSKTNTEETFNQGSYKFIKAIGDYPVLTQNDLDDTDEGIYQLGFCQFRITDEGMQDFLDTRTLIDYGIYRQKGHVLWVNDNVNSAFNSQVLDIDDVKKYDEIEIYAYRNYSSNQDRRMLTFKLLKNCSGEMNYADFYNESIRIWSRAVSFSDNGIYFGGNSINGKIDNNGLIPFKIVGYNE